MKTPLLLCGICLSVAPLIRAQTPDFAHDLGLQVSAVTPVESRVSPERLAAIAKVTGLGQDLLASVTLYRGVVTQRDRDHETVLMLLPLTGDLKGCRLALGVDRKGRTRGLGAWGNEDLDEDSTFRWGLFLSRLANGASAAPVDGELTKDAIKTKMTAIGQEKQPLVQGLVAQRMVMHWNDMIVRQHRLLANKGWNPDFSAAERVARAMRGMADRGRAFTDLLGEEQGEKYREIAATTAETLTEYAALDPDMPKAEAREWTNKAFAKDLCKQCHKSKTADGVDFRRALRGARRDLDLPRGVLLVGYDVAPALGDDGEQSQVIASATRAGLLLARAAWAEAKAKNATSPKRRSADPDKR